MARTVHVVPHTHWDREWYAPFQTFRMKLVELVDGLLDLVERDPAYAHFALDGQMAVVDDYLAIRPHEQARLRRLAVEGRLSMGPWYILMDEFLVSGETILRNLELGLTTAARFGGAADVGYLPDMFGHIAQMPQILAQFGFRHAVLWRGVPAAVGDDLAFRWVAPDGSSVRTEHLVRGYGNGAKLPDDAATLVAQVERFADEHPGDGAEPVLWMNGTDHLFPQASLGRLVAEANRLQDDWRFEVSSLSHHVQSAPSRDLPVWHGELRSGARANLLMGVTSNRVDVKQAAARAERSLERLAEPLSAVHLDAERWPAGFLDEAWRHLIHNAAHDSICACSADEVVDAVLVRFAEASAIADGLVERALLAVAEQAGGTRPLAVNPLARPRSGLVELTVAPDLDTTGAQLLWETPEQVLAWRAPAARARRLLDMVLENIGEVVAAEPTAAQDGSLDLRLRTDPGRFGLLDPTGARAAIDALAPDAEVRLWMDFPAEKRVLAHVADVAGLGWRRWPPGAPPVAPVHAAAAADARTGSLDNGVVRVEVAPDATFAVNGHGGLGRLVDGGDWGDTYNWCPPARDTLVDAPRAVRVSVAEPGPLRAALAITATYDWPADTFAHERTGTAEVTVTTRLELHAGEDLVRVTVAFDNCTRNHRLRAHFPLPEPTERSRAECAFAVVERGLTAEGGVSEQGVPTFPSRRFVQAGGLTLAHEGLLEYELVDVRGAGDDRQAAHALALTLLRATGMLSQLPMPTRPLPAGPLTPLEGPQLQGPVELRYALHLGERDPYEVADDAFVPLLGVGALGGSAGDDSSGDDSSGGLTVTGAQVSALRRVGGVLELRVFNPTDRTATVDVPGRRGWLVDLRGTPSSPFEERLELGPFALQTLRLDEAAATAVRHTHEHRY